MAIQPHRRRPRPDLAHAAARLDVVDGILVWADHPEMYLNRHTVRLIGKPAKINNGKVTVNMRAFRAEDVIRACRKE